MSVQIGRRWARRGGTHPDEGVAVLEYVGMIAAAAALMISLVAGLTPVGKHLGQKVCEAVASLTGGSCASTSAEGSADDRRPTRPCVRSSTETNGNVGVSVSVVELASGMMMKREDFADGSVRVTVGSSDKVGVSFAVGELRARLTVGNNGGAIGANASVGAAVTDGEAWEFTFRSAQDATDFQDRMVRELSRTITRQINVPIVGAGGDVVWWLIDKITGNNDPLPAPSAVIREGTVVISGKAMAEAVVAGARADVSLTSGGRIRTDADGNVTVSSRMTLTAEAAVALGMPTLVGGSVGVETTISITVDKSGQVTEVEFTGAASAQGSNNLIRLVDANSPHDVTAGGIVELNATLPVTAQNRAAVLRVLSAARASQIAGNSAIGQAAAVMDIINEAKRSGTITVQTFDATRNSPFSVATGVRAPAVGGASASADVSKFRRISTGGWFWARDGWHRWEGC